MSVATCAPKATRRKLLSGKRTNSLGWAKSDCHTCASLGRDCDRRRPRCSACLADGVICAGYVQQLNWERGSLRPGKRPSKVSRKVPEEAKPEDPTSQLPQPSAYVFVDQSQLPDRSKKKTRKDSKSSESSTMGLSPEDGIVPEPGSFSQDSLSPISPSSTSSLTSTNTSASSSLSVMQSSGLPLCPQIQRHPGDAEDALVFYHSCFSYTTLTYPVVVNPWLAASPQIRDDLPCVRYAAIALAQRQQAHFANRPEGHSILRLKSRALSIFASHLNDLSIEAGISTSLLLIALDYAETAVSNWTIHLRGALHILESHGGIYLAEHRPNLRSQIAMLIWYDVNAALISRCGPIFPREYLKALMEWQSENEWSVLALNGLPDGMFLDMYDLVVAAANIAPVNLETMADLQSRFLNAEINIQGNRHLASMSQVWKLGLLLYCSRIFPRSDLPSPFSIASAENMEATMNIADFNYPLDPHCLSFQILSMVADLPPDSNFQKQCLMPTILAACEMSAADWQYRNVAVQYCEHWKEKTGIWIFDTGLEFMRGVWARNDMLVDEEKEDTKCENWVPWTEIYPPSVRYGFLFG